MKEVREVCTSWKNDLRRFFEISWLLTNVTNWPVVRYVSRKTIVALILSSAHWSTMMLVTVLGFIF